MTLADVNNAMKDIMAGKTAAIIKADKLRGRVIVRGGAGTASRAIGLLGGIMTYACAAGIIDANPVHGVRKPKDNVRERRLSEAEYGKLGAILRDADEYGQYETAVEVIRLLAMTGCRRSEIVALRWAEVDTCSSCLRLQDSKEGKSVRPIGLPVIEALQQRHEGVDGSYVFAGHGDDDAFGAFTNHRDKTIGHSALADITPHVLRRGFASVANDLGFTEITIAALMGYSKGSVTSKYVHIRDATLVMANDTIAGYIHCLLDGVVFKQTAYALDHDARKAELAQFMRNAMQPGPADPRMSAKCFA